MWANLLKMLAVLFLNRKLMAWKGRLTHLRHQVADYTEDRAQQLRQDFVLETQRLARSLVGLLIAFSMFIFTGLLGLMWLFSLLWQHPHRSLILGLAMLIPGLIALAAGWWVRSLWQQKPLFADSLALISQDWQLFREDLAPTPAPAEAAATNPAATAAAEAAPVQATAQPAAAAAPAAT